MVPHGVQENTDFWHAADSLSILSESLYEAWVLQPERRRDAESMREAGLGAVASSLAGAADRPETVTPAGVGVQQQGQQQGDAGASTEDSKTSDSMDVSGGVSVRGLQLPIFFFNYSRQKYVQVIFL